MLLRALLVVVLALSACNRRNALATLDCVCSEGESCVDGECEAVSGPTETSCHASQELCECVCATLDTERDHCGDCDTS